MPKYSIGDRVRVLPQEECVRIANSITQHVWVSHPGEHPMPTDGFTILSQWDNSLYGMVYEINIALDMKFWIHEEWLAPLRGRVNSFFPELDEANASEDFARTLRDRMMSAK